MSSELQKFYAGKNVVVSGSNGYIASSIIPLLKSFDAKITCLSRKDTSFFEGVEYLLGDIADSEIWHALIEKADIIIHLAGNTSIYSAKEDPKKSIDSSILPILHIINAAKTLNRVPKIVFASTASIYGTSPSLPVSEDQKEDIITVYDLHKSVAEKHLQIASNEGLVDGVSLRLANVYGPSSTLALSNDRGILNKITNLALSGQPITVFGDGNYLRDYVYIDDVALAFLEAGKVNNISGQIFNIGSGKGTLIKDAFSYIVKLVDARIDKKAEIIFQDWPELADEIERRNFYADISRFVKCTDWAPSVTFEEGAERTVDYFSSNYKN
jgi:nucleoside-diphosphate-sugar epimerase